MYLLDKIVEKKDITSLEDGGAFVGAMHYDREQFANFLKHQEFLKNPEKARQERVFFVFNHTGAYPFSCPPTGAPRVFPGNSKWGNVGDFNSQGDTWKHDTNIQASGDPTQSSDSNNAKIGLNTGANHDVNAFWGVTEDAMSVGQRNVRGVSFETKQIGDTKFKPRVTGSAMVWKNASGDIKRESLSFRGNDRSYKYEGTITNESKDWKSYWGLSKKDTPWFKWSDPTYYWAGVVFHFETTWHSGGAIDSMVRIRNLRPILDRDYAERNNNDSNSPHAVWCNLGK